MSLAALLMPTKKKASIDLILSLIWVSLFFLVPGFGLRKEFSGFDAVGKAGVFALNVVIFAVFFHPAVCGAFFFHDRLGTKNRGKDIGFYASLFFLALLNPVSVSLLYSGYSYLNATVINAPCGLEVMGFPAYSSAAEAGLREGDAITSVDGSEMDTLDSLFKALGGKKPGDVVSVGTERGEFNVMLSENPVNHNAVLGVNVKQRYCRR